MNEEYLKHAKEFTHQLREFAEQGKGIIFERAIKNIVVTGVGNSISAGLLLKNNKELSVPLLLSDDAHLIIDEHTLLIALSYTGNNENTCAVVRTAIRKKAQAVIISTGGKLEHFAKSEKLPFLRIPPQLSQRHTIGYFLFSLLNILSENNLMPSQEQQIKEAIQSVDHPLLFERAQQLAKKLHGKTPLIYTPTSLVSLARWWKIRFNDTSKILAFYTTLEEATHNEVGGFEQLPKEYYGILFYDQDDNVQVKEKMRKLKDFLSEHHIPTTLIALSGTTWLSRMLSAMQLGTLTSICLAEEQDIDAESNKDIDAFTERSTSYE